VIVRDSVAIVSHRREQRGRIQCQTTLFRWSAPSGPSDSLQRP
jgi:hypothetical protein